MADSLEFGPENFASPAEWLNACQGVNGTAGPNGYGEPTGRASSPRPTDKTPPESRWLGRSDIVEMIRARAGEPWVSIGVGTSEIAQIRAGGLVTLQGPTGGGKTSLANAMAGRFAREQGWVVILSLELSADEMGGRMIGLASDASWGDVLRGKLADHQMLEALPERLTMIEWDGGTLAALGLKLSEIVAAHPEEPTMFVVDYGQLIESADAEIRMQVANNWRLAKRIAAKHRSVGLMLSQMSRASSRAARGGERLGADAVDGGAESASIERWSSLVLEIGASGPADEYGRREVQLSIAKDRMGGGDKVIPMAYEGRSGRWSVIGDAQSGADARTEAKAKGSDTKVQSAALAILHVAEHATEPRTREELCGLAGLRGATGRAAIALLLLDGRLVEVLIKKLRSPVWKLWTPANADANGVPLVGTEVGA